MEHIEMVYMNDQYYQHMKIVENIVIVWITMSHSFIHQIEIITALFLADWVKIKSIFFMRHNQVSLIIQCPSSELPNYLPTNIRVIKCNWVIELNKFSPIILKAKCDELINELKQVMEKGETVLICENKLSSQSIVICCLLLMTKFNWNLLKTLQLIQSKVSIPHFTIFQIQYLILYDKFLHVELCSQKEKLWDKKNEVSDEALLVRNTFLNSISNEKSSQLNQISDGVNTNKNKKKVCFSEILSPTTINPSMLPNKLLSPQFKSHTHRIQNTEQPQPTHTKLNKRLNKRSLTVQFEQNDKILHRLSLSKSKSKHTTISPNYQNNNKKITKPTPVNEKDFMKLAKKKYSQRSQITDISNINPKYKKMNDKMNQIFRIRSKIFGFHTESGRKVPK